MHRQANKFEAIDNDFAGGIVCGQWPVVNSE